MKSKVALISGKPEYPKPPFNPPKIYPELKINDIDNENTVYDNVRNALFLLGFDKKNFGKAFWNPLGEIIKPGDKVIIKPNFVVSKHRKKGEDKEAILCTDTHASVMRPIIDYVNKACGKKGKIIIADSPLLSEDFDKIINFTDTGRMVEHLKKSGINIEIIDLRDIIFLPKDYYSLDKKIIKNNGDPIGYVKIDLKKDSELYPIRKYYKLFRFPGVSDYGVLFEHHTKNKNIYSISKTILEADCVISVSKLKTHKKAGVTLSLKNMIGLTNRKEWLPHHREGTPDLGGDETPKKFPREYIIKKTVINFSRKIPYGTKILFLIKKTFFGSAPKKSGSSVITEGRWHGNDTIWRTCIDMNKILLYSDINGNMHRKKQRKYLSVIDGIIGGHEEGPLEPSIKKSGVILISKDPVACDFIATKIMGFSPEKIPTIKNASNKKFYLGTNDISKIEIVSNLKDPEKINLNFIPPKGWENLKS